MLTASLATRPTRPDYTNQYGSTCLSRLAGAWRLNELVFSAGWDPFSIEPSHGDLDTDLITTANTRYMPEQPDELIFWGNTRSRNGAIVNLGDNIVPAYDRGDDEQIVLSLHRLPVRIQIIQIRARAYEHVARGPARLLRFRTRLFHPLDQDDLITYEIEPGRNGLVEIRDVPLCTISRVGRCWHYQTHI